MVKSPPNIPLKTPIRLILRDGSQIRIAPGPYGKGVSIVPLASKPRIPAPRPKGPTGAPRGRRPRPSTVALRQRLEQDHKAGKMREPPQYVKWLIEQDEAVGLPMARTVVYRELRKYR